MSLALASLFQDHAVLQRDHGRPGRASGALFERVTREGDALRCHFRHVGDSLATTDGQAPRLCFVAGEDRAFFLAEARIDGTTPLVRHPKIPHPVAVRYAWADNPAEANLAAHDGLSPAGPFRSDRW